MEPAGGGVDVLGHGGVVGAGEVRLRGSVPGSARWKRFQTGKMGQICKKICAIGPNIQCEFEQALVV